MATEAITLNQKKQGGRLSLYVGLTCGAIAAVVIALVLTRAKDDAGVRVVPATRLAVVAARDIPARTRLTVDMLRVQSFKPEDVGADAFASASLLVNRVTAADILQGQVILPGQVSDSRGSGLNFTVQPGMRAVSISVKEVVTAGGNVVPGNYVDVIAVFDIDGPVDTNSLAAGLLGEAPGQPIIAGGRNQMTLTILQNVRVLAVAQNLPDQPPASSGTNSTTLQAETPNPKASTVTLEITPQQAQALVVADQYGTLRLSLRPFGEENRAPVSPFITKVK